MIIKGAYVTINLCDQDEILYSSSKHCCLFKNFHLKHSVNKSLPTFNYNVGVIIIIDHHVVKESVND